MLASTATAEARVLGHNLFGVKIKKNFKLIELPEKINKNLVDLNKCFSTLSEIDKVDGMFAARIKKYD